MSSDDIAVTSPTPRRSPWVAAAAAAHSKKKYVLGNSSQKLT